MSNQNDFTASHIFYYDQNNNPIYTKNNTQKYIINNSKLRKELQNIEGYRSFIYPERKRRFISFLLTMFISAGLLLLYYLFFDKPTKLIITTVITVTYGSIHLYIPYIFHKKIKNILDKCTLLSINESQKNKNREMYYNQMQQENKSFIENLKYITSDYNLLHLILFSIIAAPFLLLVYYIIKSWLIN